MYKYPFLQLAEATLAANISGMAVHFFDLCGPLFDEKKLGKRQPGTHRDATRQLLDELTINLNEPVPNSTRPLMLPGRVV